MAKIRQPLSAPEINKVANTSIERSEYQEEVISSKNTCIHTYLMVENKNWGIVGGVVLVNVIYHLLAIKRDEKFASD
jgi:hypothetical protein